LGRKEKKSGKCLDKIQTIQIDKLNNMISLKYENMRNVVVVGDWPENEKKEKLIQFLSLWKVYQSEPQVEKKVKQKKRK